MPRAIHDDCITQGYDDYPVVDQSQRMMRPLDLQSLYCLFAPAPARSSEMRMNHLEGCFQHWIQGCIRQTL